MPEGNIDVDSEIYIVPIGDMDEKYLHPLVAILEKRFTTKVHLALDKRVPIPDDAYDYDVQKYVGMYILTGLMNVEVPENAKILGVANVDIFLPESSSEYVFGQAHWSRNGKAAMISILRMNPGAYVNGKPDDKLLAERMAKEAIHELGHVFGLHNCPEPECVMYLPKSLKELDRKTDNFCIYCQKAFRTLTQPKMPSLQGEEDK